MQKSEFKLISSKINRSRLTLEAVITCHYTEKAVPRVKAVFSCGGKTRRMPFPVEKTQREGETLEITCKYTYLLDCLFFRHKCKEDVILSVELFYGDENTVFNLGKDGIIGKENTVAKSFYSLKDLKDKRVIVSLIRRPALIVLNMLYSLYCLFHPVKKNRVTLMSCRRDELSGNLKFVYDCLKDKDDIEIKLFLFSKPDAHKSPKYVFKFLKLYSTSHVVIVDDYFRMLNMVNKPKGVKVIQLWHACGAFKTFGFTRLGKEGGPFQNVKNHRMYDYAVVSSKEIAKHYAEGFGLSDEAVIATGVPRTDVFLSAEYAENARNAFYSKHPGLKDKKIILFAPTFRGNGQRSAYYPTELMDFDKLCSEIGEDYAVIIKLHPFCKERFTFSSSAVIDLSEEEELNDLLFVTDLLITDYSSAVFEASLLSIPMLFYAFDLEEYIESRDFYYDFEAFVPGKIVKTEDELIQCVKTESYDKEKIEPFKKRFFDSLDGKSSERIADIIVDILRGEI